MDFLAKSMPGKKIEFKMRKTLRVILVLSSKLGKIVACSQASGQ